MIYINGDSEIFDWNREPLILKIDTTNTISAGGNVDTNSSNSDQFKISDSRNMMTNDEFSYRIDWGDGSEDFISSKSDPKLLHTYAVGGEYIVRIYPSNPKSRFILYTGYYTSTYKSIGEAVKITEISQFGFASMTALVRCTNLKKVFGLPRSVPNISGSSTVAACFINNYSLQEVEYLAEIVRLMREYPLLTNLTGFLYNTSYPLDIELNIEGFVSCSVFLNGVKSKSIILNNCEGITSSTNAFRNTTELETLILNGFKSDVDIRESTKMETAAYLDLIDSLGDLTGFAAKTLTVKNNLEWTIDCQNAATAKNWNVTKI